jgi:hypothetical protein
MGIPCSPASSSALARCVLFPCFFHMEPYK